MAAKPVSLRLSEEALALLDAWAEHRATKRHRPRSRAEVIEVLLLRAAPPSAAGATESAVRRAHAAFSATRI